MHFKSQHPLVYELSQQNLFMFTSHGTRYSTSCVIQSTSRGNLDFQGNLLDFTHENLRVTTCELPRLSEVILDQYHTCRGTTAVGHVTRQISTKCKRKQFPQN